MGGAKTGASGRSLRTLSGHDVVVGLSVGRGGERLFAQLRKAHGKVDESAASEELLDYCAESDVRLSRHCEGVKRFSVGVLLAGGTLGAEVNFSEHTSDGEADPQPVSTTHQIKRQHMNGEMLDQ